MKMMQESKMDALKKLKEFLEALEPAEESNELEKGTEEELEEHDIDPEMAEELASDHLEKDPNSYSDEDEDEYEESRPMGSLSELGRVGKPVAKIEKIEIRKKKR